MVTVMMRWVAEGMITIKQFYDHSLWQKFSEICPFRIPHGYHYPENNPDDACNYIDLKTGGGVYANCCYTACMSWLDQLSEPDKKAVLEEMDRSYREMEKLDPSYHKLG